MECSSLLDSGVSEVIDEVLNSYIINKFGDPEHRSCLVQ